MKTVFFLALIGISFLALYPKDFITLSQGILYEDKIKHIMAFFTLSLLFYLSFKELENRVKFFILIGFAIFLELAQTLVGREASIADVIASSLGVLFYLLVKKVILENKRFV